jgi:hypothetical protein
MSNFDNITGQFLQLAAEPKKSSRIIITKRNKFRYLSMGDDSK